MAGERAKAPEIREDGLQLEEHRRFQERFWSAQRVAWVAFGLFLVAALFGLTGAGGPLSRSSVALESGTVDHPRIARWQGADEVTVRLAPGADQRRLTLSPDFLQALQIDGIQPQPQRAVAGPDGMRLSFATVPAAEAEVHIAVTPLQPGYFTVAISIDGGPPRELGMLVLP